MDNKYIVTTGPKAYSFHDQSTGITVIRGQQKNLTARQYRSRKIQNALSSGHLVFVTTETVLNQYSEADIKRMTNRLKSQIEKGTDITKIIKSYNLEQMKIIAKQFGFEPEDTDTVESLVKAVMDDFNKEEK